MLASVESLLNSICSVDAASRASAELVKVISHRVRVVTRLRRIDLFLEEHDFELEVADLVLLFFYRLFQLGLILLILVLSLAPFARSFAQSIDAFLEDFVLPEETFIF